MVITTTANGIFATPTKDTFEKKLFASKLLLALRKEWFSSHKFLAGTLISNKKYKHLRSIYKINFYLFNNKLDYDLAHYFAQSKNTKGNINKYLTNLFIAPFTKKLSYKNPDE